MFKPGTLHRLSPLLALAVVLSGFCILHAVFNPFKTDVPLCVTYRLTGYHCPGCGATRAAYALTNGDLRLAVHNNVLFIMALLLFGGLWIRWIYLVAAGKADEARFFPWQLTTGQGIAILSVMLIFAILRNLSAFAFIAPTF